MRSNTLDAARRAYLGIVRSVFNKADDSKRMQVVDVRHLHNEQNPGTERFQEYGFTVVPLPPDEGGRGAEALTLFLNGNRSHPVVIKVDDRRYRKKNLKPGESAHHDDQGQNSYIARDGHYHTAKQHVMTAGAEPATVFELNEQLKGMAARLAQAEHNLHGLFDVTSQMRQIAQQTIPGLAVLAPILNQDPSGLPIMAQAIAGKEMAYLQQQVEQALEKFLSPNLAGLASLLSGGLEASITSLQGQIGQLLTQNPVVGQVDGLVAEIAALAASGNEAGVIATGTAALQGQVEALTAANPIVGTVAGLRQTLAGLIGQAGPGLNFLAPQQRLVQGLSSSLRITQ